MKLYRIWWGDSNDRREIAQAFASSIEEVESFVEEEFLEGIEKGDIDIHYEDIATIYMISICSTCEERSEEVCEFCENNSEYIEIEECEEVNDECEHSFNLITGESLMWRENVTGELLKDENWNHGFLNVLRMTREIHI